MPKCIISEGKTTSEAIEKGLKELGVSKEKVEIKVLENEEKRSFFSILAPRVVKVELKLKENELKSNNDNTVKKEKIELSAQELKLAEENVKRFLDEILPKIGKQIQYQVKQEEYGLEVTINGEESSVLIGYRGETLYDFQNILSIVSNKNIENTCALLFIPQNKQDHINTHD